MYILCILLFPGFGRSSKVSEVQDVSEITWVSEVQKVQDVQKVVFRSKEGLRYDILEHIACLFSLEAGVRKFKQCLETIILRINMLKLTKDDTSNDIEDSLIDIPYNIPNLQFPFTPTIKQIDNLMCGYTTKETSFLNMYT